MCDVPVRHGSDNTVARWSRAILEGATNYTALPKTLAVYILTRHATTKTLYSGREYCNLYALR